MYALYHISNVSVNLVSHGLIWFGMVFERDAGYIKVVRACACKTFSEYFQAIVLFLQYDGFFVFNHGQYVTNQYYSQTKNGMPMKQ